MHGLHLRGIITAGRIRARPIFVCTLRWLCVHLDACAASCAQLCACTLVRSGRTLQTRGQVFGSRPSRCPHASQVVLLVECCALSLCMLVNARAWMPFLCLVLLTVFVRSRC